MSSRSALAAAAALAMLSQWEANLVEAAPFENHEHHNHYDDFERRLALPPPVGDYTYMGW